MSKGIIALLAIIITISLFGFMRFLYGRFTFAVLHPVLTTTTVIVLILVAYNISYEDYMEGGQWIEKFLGAAVVSLAYPLYRQRKKMVQYKNAIILGISSGIITAMGSVIFFAKVFNLENELLYTILPKSITTPVAIQLSETIAGIPSLTAVFVMLAGFSGVIIGPIVMKLTKIESPLGIGIALGSAAHALGTAKATEYGEVALSMASVAMTLSAIAGALIGPVLILLI